MAAPVMHLFDRFENRLGTVRALGAAVHAEEIGGEDTLEFDCEVAPQKGDRIVWLDPGDGVWREHEVVRTDEPAGGPAHVYAESSACELLRDFVDEVQLVRKTAAQAVAAALGPTRWALGTANVDVAKQGCLLYHVNALAALRRIEEVWGGELEFSVQVAGGRVARRKASLLARRGDWRGARLTLGKNMAGCTRRVLSDEVFTALYGFGKGLPRYDDAGHATGGYTRRISFESVNNGVKWVGDDDARQRWGRWDAARGEKAHAFGCVTFPDCEDPAELLALTRAALADACRPKVSYEVDAAALGGVPVRLGDDVAVSDRSRGPDLRLVARVVRRVRELGPGEAACSLVLGSVEGALWRAQADVAARAVAAEQAAAAAADAVAAMDEVDLSEVTF